jgi:thioredoxin-like negative regulator of GroEL
MRILFFTASWCAACHAITKYVPDWCERIDCDADTETAAKYRVTTLPLFVAVDDCNDEIDRIHTTSMTALVHWRDKLDG